ncbi:zinc ribbon domain-containing protein [Methanobrevibacter sp.]|uniref:zinc ribbon domain-containing protein n=1 Tax=Methanobrevibacter sp. TaxID=66852 RepID=UPI00388CF5C1
MVFCPNCGAENNDTAKFCKNCGSSLSGGNPIKDNYVATGNAPSAQSGNSNFNTNSNNSNSKSDNKNLIIISLTIIICALLIAGALVMFSGNGNDNDDSALSDSASLNGASDTVNESADDSSTSDDSTESSTVAQDSSPRIISGSFSTGSSASDKTHCTVYVGSEHAGEKVKISVLYSNDGYALNQGKIVPKTVSSDGYVKVASAYAFDYYPDEAYITLYDNNGNVLDTQTVYLNENSGKQTFS